MPKIAKVEVLPLVESTSAGTDCDGAVDTLVVLMGLRRLPEIVERLLAAGRAGETPSAVVSNGSLPSQQVVTATLAELPAAVAGAGLSPPAIIVIGDVVRLRCPDVAPAGSSGGLRSAPA